MRGYKNVISIHRYNTVSKSIVENAEVVKSHSRKYYGKYNMGGYKNVVSIQTYSTISKSFVDNADVVQSAIVECIRMYGAWVREVTRM